MFVVASKYDKFLHRVGDLDTLEDLLYGVTDNMGDAKRIASVAKCMNVGDIFVSNGISLVYQEDV